MGNTYFISGMAQGADLILANLVLELKKKYKDLFLECALPFSRQSEKWGEEYKKQYQEIIAGCDKMTVLAENYSKNGYINRNKYMVDNSGIVIAVYDGKQGGTKFTINYAVKKSRQIIIINPLDNNVYTQLKAVLCENPP